MILKTFICHDREEESTAKEIVAKSNDAAAEQFAESFRVSLGLSPGEGMDVIVHEKGTENRYSIAVELGWTVTSRRAL